ncbi:hypothetical protein [Fontivita pretiosa]|uniref:hypothetical protein n=1 Tax=Fontivita pretiosa TaxID=2989684 RepID=UPI003D16DA57
MRNLTKWLAIATLGLAMLPLDAMAQSRIQQRQRARDGTCDRVGQCDQIRQRKRDGSCNPDCPYAGQQAQQQQRQRSRDGSGRR